MNPAHWVVPAAGFVTGAVLAAGLLTGGALLLHVERGFLLTFSFLTALALAALAAGFWASRAGPAEAGRVSRIGLRRGWGGAILAFAVAAGFAALWIHVGAVREALVGRALGVVFFLAEPAYAGGLLLAALAARQGEEARNPVTVPGFAGAAAGVLGAGAFLPRVHPAAVFVAAAVALAACGAWDARRQPAAAGSTTSRRRRMKDRVVIITGVGDRGQVGYALAAALLDAGARVFVTDVRPEVEELAGELAGRGEAAGLRADLTRPEEAQRVVEAARSRFGGVDALVNAAGGLGVIKAVAETEPAEWETEWRRNAETAFLMCRAALPALRERRGAIVNFASPAGLRAAPSLGAYSAAKAGVIALTRALALEEKDNGVRVNAVAPGFIDTEQNRRAVEDPDLVGWVTREQIARVVVFLAGDSASGVSGETIHVLGDSLE